jgi:peptidoglycan/xylan/chitin deacetylase (PgdA/CDA1 family)
MATGAMVKAAAKRTVYFLGQALQINALSRRMNRAKLLVLCYHGVVSDASFAASAARGAEFYLYRNAVGLAQFRRQIEMMAKLFSPVSAADVDDWLQGRRELPPNPVLVTFDDGFRNNLTLAAPVLEQFGVPAVFHVATGYIGAGRVLWPLLLDKIIMTWPKRDLPLPDQEATLPLPESPAERVSICQRVRSKCKALRDKARQSYLERLRGENPLNMSNFDRELVEFLNWDEVRTLHQKGFTIGSHTIEHPILSRLEPDSLARELGDSRLSIEREIGAPCNVLAYPNGHRDDYSAEVVSATRDAGYRLAFTLAGDFNSVGANPLEVSRICISSEVSDNAFRAMVSGLYGHMKVFA